MVVKKAIVKAVTKTPLVLGEYYNGLVVVTGAVKLIRQRKLLHAASLENEIRLRPCIVG